MRVAELASGHGYLQTYGPARLLRHAGAAAKMGVERQLPRLFLELPGGGVVVTWPDASSTFSWPRFIPALHDGRGSSRPCMIAAVYPGHA